MLSLQDRPRGYHHLGKLSCYSPCLQDGNYCGQVLAQLAHFVSAHTLHHHQLHIVSLLIFMHRVYSLGHMIMAYIYVPDDTHVGYNSTA